MGLLDSLFGSMDSTSKLTPQESFAGILMGASGCDGHIADDEVNGLITCLVRMKLFQRFDGRQFGKTLNKLHGLMKKKGVEALIDACTETLPHDLKRAAFANACDIVLADGVVEQDEKIFMERLRDKLQIEAKVAKTIVEVMIIKNKG